MKEILNELINYKTLDRQAARSILLALGKGEFNESQMAAFLTVFMMRTITVEELSGFREALLEMCLEVDLGTHELIDLCGTGGDQKDTFNISTLTSFVVAGAGYLVAKHGNNGVSSVCGSSNLMTHFGYEFTNEVDALKRQLNDAGICFLHAPLFHPAMKNVAPVRKALGTKTFFNMLGPMVNPARPDKQMTGVFSLELARLYGYLYQQTDKYFSIVHSLDGYDEVSLTGPFKVITKNGEVILTPEELGLKRLSPESIFGGDTVAATAKIFENVISGNGTPEQESVVLANAACAIQCCEATLDFTEAYEKAKDALKGGAALKAFKKLIVQN